MKHKSSLKETSDMNFYSIVYRQKGDYESRRSPAFQAASVSGALDKFDTTKYRAYEIVGVWQLFNGTTWHPVRDVNKMVNEAKEKCYKCKGLLWSTYEKDSGLCNKCRYKETDAVKEALERKGACQGCYEDTMLKFDPSYMKWLCKKRLADKMRVAESHKYEAVMNEADNVKMQMMLPSTKKHKSNTFCAWCKKGIGYNKGFKPGETSHGICNKCATKFFNEIKFIREVIANMPSNLIKSALTEMWNTMNENKGCPFCQGSGNDTDNDGQPCPACNGTGDLQETYDKTNEYEGDEKFADKEELEKLKAQHQKDFIAKYGLVTPKKEGQSIAENFDGDAADDALRAAVNVKGQYYKMKEAGYHSKQELAQFTAYYKMFLFVSAAFKSGKLDELEGALKLMHKHQEVGGGDREFKTVYSELTDAIDDLKHKPVKETAAGDISDDTHCPCGGTVVAGYKGGTCMKCGGHLDDVKESTKPHIDLKKIVSAIQKATDLEYRDDFSINKDGTIIFNYSLDPETEGELHLALKKIGINVKLTGNTIKTGLREMAYDPKLGTDPDLDKEDYKPGDVWHTNAGKWGAKNQMGNVEYFPGTDKGKASANFFSRGNQGGKASKKSYGNLKKYVDHKWTTG